jgi:hypothetical protein
MIMEWIILKSASLPVNLHGSKDRLTEALRHVCEASSNATSEAAGSRGPEKLANEISAMASPIPARVGPKTRHFTSREISHFMF